MLAARSDMMSRRFIRGMPASAAGRNSASLSPVSLQRFSSGCTGSASRSGLVTLDGRRASLYQTVRSLHQTSLLLEAKSRAARAGRAATTSAKSSSKPARVHNASRPAASSARTTSKSGRPLSASPSSSSSVSSSPPLPSATSKSPSPPTATSTVATTPAEGDPTNAPSKSLKERARELWATAKYLFKFYFNGVKQIWANRKRVSEIQRRVTDGGSPLTREESQLIRVHRADMRKLPLFITILLILEEALPLVVIWAPSLLPSTCILPNQLLKIRMKEEVTRATAHKQLKEVEEIQSLIPVVQGTGAQLALGEAHQSKDEDVLTSIKGETLAQLAKVYSLSTWGGATMTRRRLTNHLKYIRDDDALMCEGGNYASIPQHADAIAKACAERGLRATEISQKEMYESLRTWLRYTTREPATAQHLSTSSLSLLPLQLYNAASIQEIESSLEAEKSRGLIAKTKDVLNEVVEEEKKVIERDQKSQQEIQAKTQQQATTTKAKK